MVSLRQKLVVKPTVAVLYYDTHPASPSTDLITPNVSQSNHFHVVLFFSEITDMTPQGFEARDSHTRGGHLTMVPSIVDVSEEEASTYGVAVVVVVWWLLNIQSKRLHISDDSNHFRCFEDPAIQKLCS